ncbi:MAG: hypothetical protein C4293_18285 [Nitrospiraceae bacterium]
MRLFLAACTLLSVVLLAASVYAAEPIRVLLFQNAKRIMVKAEQGLRMRLPNGEERIAKAPIRVTAASAGLLINGTRVGSGPVLLHSREGDLTVAIEQPSIGGQRSVSKGAVPAGSPPDQFVIGGTLQLVGRGGELLVINELDVEEYVKGVVPSEMNAAWHPEALKVQAVATRTYALYQQMMSAGRDYDLVASIQDQVYGGRHGVDQRIEQAVEATRGLVVTYNNAPILAAFSSTAAGPTEDAMIVWAKDLPYLKGVDCPFDASSPYYQWRAEVTLHDLEQTLRKQGVAVGTIASLTPYVYSRSGRVDKIRILHSEGELILRGQDLRRIVGYSLIPSTQFEVETVGREVVLAGRGAGHAVGLCQWGAKELAELGYSFSAILQYYFPGTELKQMPLIEPASLPAS